MVQELGQNDVIVFCTKGDGVCGMNQLATAFGGSFGGRCGWFAAL